MVFRLQVWRTWELDIVPGVQTAQFVFRPPGIDVFLMFSNTASRARRARGTQTPDLIVAREDSQMAPASRVPASFATRACRGVRTPPFTSATMSGKRYPSFRALERRPCGGNGPRPFERVGDPQCHVLAPR